VQISSAQPEHLGNYDVVVFNNAGSATSSNATLTLAIGARSSLNRRVCKSAFARSSSRAHNERQFQCPRFQHSPLSLPMALQGADIAGATTSTLTVTNVQLAMAAITPSRSPIPTELS
jgi:hypothetical protein